MPTPASTIRTAREKRGYSLRQLARRASCTHTAIHLWERGERTPRPRYAAAIERALGLPAGSVLESERPPARSAEGQELHDAPSKEQGENCYGQS